MEEIPSICGFCFVVWNGSGLGHIRAQFNPCGHSAAPPFFVITNSIPLLNQRGLEPITGWFGKASSSLQSDTRHYAKGGSSMSMELCIRFKDQITGTASYYWEMQLLNLCVFWRKCDWCLPITNEIWALVMLSPLVIRFSLFFLQIVNLIEETGHFHITNTTFDFDLCSLDKTTVRKLQSYLETSGSSWRLVQLAATRRKITPPFLSYFCFSLLNRNL